MNDVPVEVLGIIFSLMDGISLLNCSIVCKHWKEQSSKSNLWKKLCDTDWPDVTENIEKRYDGNHKKAWMNQQYRSFMMSILPDIIANINEDKEEKILEISIKKLKDILTWNHDVPIKLMEQSGFTNAIVPLLTSNKDSIQELGFYLLSLFTPLATGNDIGNLSDSWDLFLDMLRSTNEQLKTYSMKILGSLIELDDDVKQYALDADIIPTLSDFISDSLDNVIIHDSLSVIFSILTDPFPSLESIEEFLPVASKLLYTEDVSIIQNALEIFSKVANQSSPYVVAVADQKIEKRLIELLEHQDDTVCIKATQTVGKILYEDQYVMPFLNENVHVQLKKNISRENSEIKTLSVWALSNIVSKPPHIEIVEKEQLIDVVMELYSNSSKSVKFESLWVISNTLHNGLSEQIDIYCDKGALGVLLNSLLTIDDKETLDRVMETISNLLERDNDKYLLYMEKDDPYSVFPKFIARPDISERTRAKAEELKDKFFTEDQKNKRRKLL